MIRGRWIHCGHTDAPLFIRASFQQRCQEARLRDRDDNYVDYYDDRVFCCCSLFGITLVSFVVAVAAVASCYFVQVFLRLFMLQFLLLLLFESYPLNLTVLTWFSWRYQYIASLPKHSHSSQANYRCKHDSKPLLVHIQGTNDAHGRPSDGA